MSQPVQFSGSVSSPAGCGQQPVQGCSAPGTSTQIALEFQETVVVYDRVLSGDLILPVQASYVPLPLASLMTTIGFLAMALDQDSTPILVYVGTTPADDGANPVTDNMVLSPNGTAGNLFWYKGGPATAAILVAGT